MEVKLCSFLSLVYYAFAASWPEQQRKVTDVLISEDVGVKTTIDPQYLAQTSLAIKLYPNSHYMPSFRGETLAETLSIADLLLSSAASHFLAFHVWVSQSSR